MGLRPTFSPHTCTVHFSALCLCVVQPASLVRPVLPCHTRSGASAVRDAQVLTPEPPHSSRCTLPPILGRWPPSLPHHALLLLLYIQWEPEDLLQRYTEAHPYYIVEWHSMSKGSCSLQLVCLLCFLHLHLHPPSAADLEPPSPTKFNTQYEKDMTDLHKARAVLVSYITSVTSSKSPLFINTNAERFQLFTR